MKKRKNQPETDEVQEPKYVYSLDIGTTKIVMTSGYLCSDGKVEVCGYGQAPSTGVQYGMVINLQDTIDGIQIAKKQLEEATGQQVDEVFVGIAGRHIKSVTCSHSVTRINGRQQIIKKEEVSKWTSDMEQYEINSGSVIAVIPQNYCIDGTDTTRADGMVGQNIVATYQLITGDDFEIRKIVKSVTDSNLRMQKLMLEPLASSVACLSEEEKHNGVAMIDIGGGTTDLIIYKKGVPVYLRVIPIGGQVVTKDIQALGMTYEEAEQIKIEYGSCVPEKADKNHFITVRNSVYFARNVKINERDLALVINARVKRDILEPVKLEIEKSGFMNDIICVVITGGGARLNDIKSLSEFVLEKRVRIGIPGFGFTQTLEPALRDPIYSTALGLLSSACRYHGKPYEGNPVKDDNRWEEVVSTSDEESNDVDDDGSPGLIPSIMSGIDRLVKKMMKSLSDGSNEGVD